MKTYEMPKKFMFWAVFRLAVAATSVSDPVTVVSIVPLALQMPNQVLLTEAEQSSPWQLSPLQLVQSPFQCCHHSMSQTKPLSILHVSHFQSYTENN
jgi:hypothetical protein